MRSIVCLAVLVLLVALPTPTRGATVPYRTDAELIALATRVVRGRVLDSVAERRPDGTIRTRTRLAVLEDFTGGADRVVTIYELGGVLGDGASMVVPGSPHFTRGDEVVLCLERTGDGFRTVALAFSAFAVGSTSGGVTPLSRLPGELTVVGRQRAAGDAARTLEGFRDTAAGVVGRGSRLVVDAVEAAAMVAQTSEVEAPFTLSDIEGRRWREADSGQTVAFYRNTLTPSPIVGADTDTEIRTALAAWSGRPGAALTLAFAGTKLVPFGSDALCPADNAGAGLITFGDPRDEIASGLLAIGGGCGARDFHVASGRGFHALTHGFVVLNDNLALLGYNTTPNVTRVLEHEIGHAIGFGHTCDGTGPPCAPGDAVNIMYPSCCTDQSPLPPALGPDDLAGLLFVYPANAPCSFLLSSGTDLTFGAPGGEELISVTPSRETCTWTAVSHDGFVVVSDPGSGIGTGTVRVLVPPNFRSTTRRTGTLTIASKTVNVLQLAANLDFDGDALPDSWELAFGLNEGSGTGDDGPAGDPDHDGVSNAAEFAAGTHPRGAFTRYLAEGAANDFFDTEIALFNPSSAAAHVWLRVQPEGGTEIGWPVLVFAGHLNVVRGSVFKGLAGRPFSTVIESDLPVIVDRTMRWDKTGYGSSGETAIEAPATTWYLAEGSTSGDFALFYLLQNPGDAATTATVRFLRPAPQPPLERTYTVPPRARLTIPVDAIPELVSTDVSGVVTSTQPIIVERAMYLSRPGQPFAAGHESAGVTSPATEWFLAEGATGTFFDLFVLIENPGPQAASVRIDYLLPNGTTLSKAYAVAPESRYTIYVDDEQLPAGSGQRPLASTAMSMRITSTNGTPIIVERSMWWPQPAWYEAHNAPASTVTGTRWATASGLAGGPKQAETYVLIANPGAVPATVSVSVTLDVGTVEQATYTLPPSSRTTVPIGATFASALGRRFAVVVSSTGAQPAPIVVEQAVYESPGGVTWAAGTAEPATRLVP